MRVYVFEGKNRVKVGYSYNPTERIKQVQPNLSDDITLVFETEDLKNYKLIERLVHKLLKSHRTKGEWFGVSSAVAIDAIHKAIDIANNQLEDEYLKSKKYSYEKLNISLTGDSAALARSLRTKCEIERGVRMSLADVVNLAIIQLEDKLKAKSK